MFPKNPLLLFVIKSMHSSFDLVPKRGRSGIQKLLSAGETAIQNARPLSIIGSYSSIRFEARISV